MSAFAALSFQCACQEKAYSILLTGEKPKNNEDDILVLCQFAFQKQISYKNTDSWPNSTLIFLKLLYPKRGLLSIFS